MLSNINRSVLKYLIYSIVILGIVFFLPKNKLSHTEYLLVVLPIIGLYIIIDLATCSKSSNVIVRKAEKFKNSSSESITKKSPRAILSSLKKKTPKSQSKKLAKIAKKLSPKKIARLAK